MSPQDRLPLARAFATMLEASAAPYGYTITIWSSGALLSHFRSSPNLWQVLLFIVGAIGAFTVLGLGGRRAVARAKPIRPDPARVWAGVLDWFAVGLAVGAAALTAQVDSWAAWPASSFAATVIYLSAASFQLALATGRER